MIGRRAFLETIGTAGAALAMSPLSAIMPPVAGTNALRAAEAKTDGDSKQFEIALMNTIVDWLLIWPGRPSLTWNAEGVKKILDLHAEGGNKTVYWRTMDGGKAMYRTKIGQVAKGPEDLALTELLKTSPDHARAYQKLVCDEFDILGTAVEYGHSLGMKVIAWAEIYHEDHGLGPTKLQREHLEWHRVYRNFKRPSTPDWAEWAEMSWAFPGVREHKIGMLEEMLGYGVDGIFFDMVRGRDWVDPEGVYDGGYDEPTVEGYKQKTGKDPWKIPNSEPSWIEYRSEVLTTALREVRGMMKKFDNKELILYIPGINNSVYVMPPDMNGEWAKAHTVPLQDEYKGSLIQVENWAREKLFDALCTSHWPQGGPPPVEGMKAQVERYLPLLKGNARYLPELYGFNVPRDTFEQMIDVAKQAGCDGVVVSEDGCFLGNATTWKDLAHFNAKT